MKAEPNGKRLDRAVFIVTSGRSGGTLLRVMLAGHSGLFSPPELNLLPFHNVWEMNRTLGPCPSKPCAQAGCDFREGLQRALMEIDGVSASAAARRIECWGATRFPIREVYRYLQAGITPRILVDKSPMYTLRTITLHGAELMFDRPLYIHLVRHPVAAIAARVREGFPLSPNWLDKGDDFEPVSGRWQLVESFWRVMNRNAAMFLANIPLARKTLVRFEDLVVRTEEVMRSLCAFLGQPFENAVLDPYQGRRMFDGVVPGTRSSGGPEFYALRRIESSEAHSWRLDGSVQPVCAATLEVAAQLGYAREAAQSV